MFANLRILTNIFLYYALRKIAKLKVNRSSCRVGLKGIDRNLPLGDTEVTPIIAKIKAAMPNGGVIFNSLDRLSAEIKDLDITIAKSTLKSPYNGIVAARNLDEGTVIEAGQSVLRLVENARPKVKIGVPINVANSIQPGSPQQVMIGDKEYQATVSSVLPEVNTATRTRTVVLRLSPSAATQVSPQQIARLQVTQDSSVEGYWLPINALVKSDRGLWSCYALIKSEGNSIAERRYLELLETEGDRVLVKGTVQPGDEIIIDGTHRLIPGQIIKQAQR